MADIPGAKGGRPLCAPCSEQTRASEARRIGRRGIRAAVATARAGGLPVDLTPSKWAETIEHFGDACAYCGGIWYVVEHATPTRRGGGTTWDNCVPACFSCNVAKGTMTIDEWATLTNARRLPDTARLAKALAWLRARGRKP